MRRTLPALFAFAFLAFPALPAVAQTPEVSALKKSCEKEANAADCYKLGGLHARGEGIPKDPGKAAGFYKKACEGNNAAGCLDLAAMHRSGEGASKDVQKAALLLKRGCDLGNSDGCTELGL